LPVPETITATASCPGGQVAIGGGGTIAGSVTGAVTVVISQSFRSASDTWTVIYQVAGPFGADTGASTAAVTAHAICTT
jgi:ABC-type branched-subunit amino acid transport system permease subunit